VKRDAVVEWLLALGHLPEKAGQTGHAKYVNPKTGNWITLPPDPETPPVLVRGICRILEVPNPREVNVGRERNARVKRRVRPRKRHD